jgi:urea transport system ATP-binding protein
MFNITNLASGYGQSQVIHEVSLNVAKQEIVAVMGRNGMGKTTLFKTLMGILPTRGGSVTVDGKEVSAMESYQRVESGIAYVPQGRMIFSHMTVLENIQTGLPASAKGKVPEEFYALFPVLYDMRSRKGGNLSGGQQQQLAIARALATNPKVLLLDEPTEGIQPSIIKDIAKSLKEIRTMRDLTIVVSEQVLSFTLELADRFLVIEKGKFVYDNTRANVDAATITRRYFKQQGHRRRGGGQLQDAAASHQGRGGGKREQHRAHAGRHEEGFAGPGPGDLPRVQHPRHHVRQQGNARERRHGAGL